MKKTLTSSITVKTENFHIDYENGYQCNYTLQNGELSSYEFIYNDKRVKYVKDISEYQNTHWSDWKRVENNLTQQELESFSEFDSLYHITESMIYRRDVPLSTIIIIGETFSHIYLNLETTQSECQTYLDSLPDKFFRNKEIVYIPYYNQNESKDFHYTVRFEIYNIPQEIYQESIVKDYVCDYTKKAIIEKLRIK